MAFCINFQNENEALPIYVHSVAELTAMTIFLTNRKVIGYASKYAKILKTRDDDFGDVWEVTQYNGMNTKTIKAIPISRKDVREMGLLYAATGQFDNDCEMAQIYYFGKYIIHGILTDADKEFWKINLNVMNPKESSITSYDPIKDKYTNLTNVQVMDETSDETRIRISNEDDSIIKNICIDLTDFPIARFV